MYKLIFANSGNEEDQFTIENVPEKDIAKTIAFYSKYPYKLLHITKVG
jgi:hypothetical protein